MNQSDARTPDQALTRRQVLRGFGMGAGMLAGSALLGACSPTGSGSRSTATDAGSGSPQGEDVPVGWIQPLTGRLAEAYAPAYLTAKIAIDEINEAGGLLGSPLVPLEVDDEGSPSGQATVAQRLAQEGVPVAIGPTGSSQALASARALAPHNVLQSAWGGPPALGDPAQFPHHFQLVMNTQDQGRVATRFLYEVQEARTIGVIAEDTDFGSAITSAMREALDQEYGVSLASEQVFPVDETDMTPYVRALERAGVDAVGIWSGQPSATALSLRAMDASGYGPTILVHDLNYPEGLYDEISSELMGQFYGTIYRNLTYERGADPAPRMQDWADRILNHPDMVEGATFAAAGSPYYDWLTLLRQVVDDVGSLDTEKVVAALERLEGYEGMLGNITFTPDSHSGITADQITIGTMGSGIDGGIFRERVPGL